MGSGAPKKIESIPVNLLVNVYAAEGMMHVAAQNLVALLKLASANPEDADWTDIQKQREDLMKYTKQYVFSIQAVERYMGK